MLARIHSAAIHGVDAYPVQVEVDVARGDHHMTVVGLPDAAVRESCDRVQAAIRNSGFEFPLERITVNLAPADIRKEGPNFDLPIAIGMLAAQDEIPAAILERFAMVGELALSGEVRRVRGVLPVAMCARDAGLSGILVPSDNAEEAGVVNGLDVYPVLLIRRPPHYSPLVLPLSRLNRRSQMTVGQ